MVLTKPAAAVFFAHIFSGQRLVDRVRRTVFSWFGAFRGVCCAMSAFETILGSQSRVYGSSINPSFKSIL